MAAKRNFFKRLLGKKDAAPSDNAIWESVSDVATVAQDPGDVRLADRGPQPARPAPLSQTGQGQAGQGEAGQGQAGQEAGQGEAEEIFRQEGSQPGPPSSPEETPRPERLKQPEGIRRQKDEPPPETNFPTGDLPAAPPMAEEHALTLEADADAAGADISALATPLDMPPPPFPDFSPDEESSEPDAFFSQTPPPLTGLRETGLPEQTLPEQTQPEQTQPERGQAEQGQRHAKPPETGLSETGLTETGLSGTGLTGTGLAEMNASGSERPAAASGPEAVIMPDRQSDRQPDRQSDRQSAKKTNKARATTQISNPQPESSAAEGIAPAGHKEAGIEAEPLVEADIATASVAGSEITAQVLTEALRGEGDVASSDRGISVKPLLDDVIQEPVIPLIEKIPEDDSEVSVPDPSSQASPSPDLKQRRAFTPDKKPGTVSRRGLFARLSAGLARSSNKLSQGVGDIFMRRKLDDETLEELEDLLVSADLGVGVAQRLTAKLAKGKFDRQVTGDEIKLALAAEIEQTLADHAKPLTLPQKDAQNPIVILVAGVNGAGKTTTLAKLGRRYIEAGKSVMLVAGDTFRAAAIEQLSVWGARMGARVMAREPGADAAGLAYDALKTAVEEKIDIVLVDTAGRLQNKTALMDELSKIIRVIRKIDGTAPHHRILVLDATVGQNALSQTSVFHEVADITGLIMTKLDGTAKGGILVSLADKFALPIHYIGVGENIDDLQRFEAGSFARALTGIEL